MSREEWHPQQCGRWLQDGCDDLQVPYIDEKEIVMDVLRHGNQVRVAQPAQLAGLVRKRHAEAAYQD